MKGYDFRATRVLDTAKRLLEVERANPKHRLLHIRDEPAWLKAVSQNPSPQILVRTQPVQHTGYGRQRPTRKLKKQYIPQQISYPEDRMRKAFFSDHPWELARPRILLERNKADGGENWEEVRPKGLGLQPENVIRRQLWLIEHENKTPQIAYNIARREFYQERFREDIERKVAKEEALHVGGYFGKSTIAWGMELEDRKFHGFKKWARQRAVKNENTRLSQLSGGDEASLGLTAGAEEVDADAAAEELIEQDKEVSEDQPAARSSSPLSRATSRSARRQPDIELGIDNAADRTGASLRM